MSKQSKLKDAGLKERGQTEEVYVLKVKGDLIGLPSYKNLPPLTIFIQPLADTIVSLGFIYN